MFRTASVLLATVVITVGPALAQPEPRSPEERRVAEVCRSDALTHCTFQVFDRERLAGCFRQNFSRMSPPCQDALRAANAANAARSAR